MSEEIVKILLPDTITPSNNELLKMHWGALLRLKESYMWTLTAAGAHDPKYKAEPGEHRVVKFLSCRRNMLDEGNLAGGFKKLEDALVEMGLLIDDSPKYASMVYAQRIDRKEPRTEILILKGGKK